MGSLCSACCRKKKPPNKQKSKKDRFLRKQEYRVFTENHFVKKDETTCNLQHISEREPEFEKDPSLHPSLGPLFMQRSKSELKINRNRRKSQANLTDECRPLKKSNSCSTIFIDDSTVSHPHLINTIKCVTLAIYYHIKNRTSNNVIDIFDERIHPFSKNPNEQDIREPDHRMIYRCVKNLFFAAHLSPECAIITLVYLERLLICAEIDIVPCTWKRIILGAILLASKVWDDQSIWNADFCLILKDITIEDMYVLLHHFSSSVFMNTFILILSLSLSPYLGMSWKDTFLNTSNLT